MIRNRLSIILLTIAWLTAMWYNLAMMNGSSLTMDGGCPIMSHETQFCPMTIAQHIDRWISIFVATSPLLIIALGLELIRRIHPRPTGHEINYIVRQRWRRRTFLIFRPYNFFIYRGLLQPLIYA